MIEQVRRLRYPTLWDAVRTAKAGPRASKNALETRLAAHANDVLRTTNPHRVPLQAPQVNATGRVSQKDLLQTTHVIVDRESHRGRILDVGPHTLALGARIGDRYLTTVYDRRTAPYIALELTTQRTPALPALT